MPPGYVLVLVNELADLRARAGFSDGWIVWPPCSVDQVAAAVDREREKWIGGIKVSFPTDAMEQEIASHVRRAVGREREKWADTLRNMAAVSWGEWDERADPIEQGKAIALDHAAELLWPAIRAESECNTPQPEPPADGHGP